MLSASLLTAMNPAAFDYSSPRNPCRVRRGGGYRNDPYRAAVIASPYKLESPTTRHYRAVAAYEAATTVVPPQCLVAVPPSPAPAVVVQAAAAPVAVAAPTESALFNTSLVISESSGRSASPVPSMASTVPAAGSSSTLAPNERCVVVEFKHETCMYRAPFRVAVGDSVVVEADRGENIGRVAEICVNAPTYDVPNKVLRRASAQEMQAVEALRTNEVQITVNVQRIAESVGLGVKVVDTEFQSDMNKLTVFYSSRSPVDFRKLQRTLFRDYRCRIWLVNWSEVEFRKKQADRCLGVSICSKLGSRLNASAKGGRPAQEGHDTRANNHRGHKVRSA